MENQKVSVIIPAYNAEKTLMRCINSVSNQTYKNYEIIVVDNSSTDKTKEIIEEFCKKDNRIKYLFEPKIGRGAARYKGEINSGGEIILMTDSDCIVPENWIVEMIEPIIKNKSVAAQGIKKPIVINYWTRNFQKEAERLIMERLRDKKVGLVDTANFAIKKSILKEIGYSNPNIFVRIDTEIMARLKIKKYEVYLNRVEILHYHPDTALKLFKNVFEKGEWDIRIRNMYNNQKEIFPIAPKLSPLYYFIGIALELLKLDKKFKYNLVTGIAWRLGLSYGWIKNILLK